MVLAGLAAAFWWGRQPSDEVAALASRNPEWSVDSHLGWVVLTEQATRKRVVIAPEQVGPHRVRRVTCAEVERAFPRWFRLPADSGQHEPLGCVRVSGPAEDSYVINVLTALEIPKLWDDLYGPVLDTAGLPYAGGHSAHGRRGRKLDREVIGAEARPQLSGASPPRGSATLAYVVDPEPGSDAFETRITAVHVGDETLLIATFRRLASAPGRMP
ncbi:hypothetical protein [Piscinibacter koreensis]|uniref:Uncharacterized protein n=1 Tax=Piscinibacter koreensis TaxID=2742824 RepID=A0A7Y6NRF7_9BURK|nr:hypothetical protein [Schlegelella koreensis]NUZ07973.1 hypothetical protein [Schlegelella koreensis]